LTLQLTGGSNSRALKAADELAQLRMPLSSFEAITVMLVIDFFCGIDRSFPQRPKQSLERSTTQNV
jgi:hypothetical protein